MVIFIPSDDLAPRRITTWRAYSSPKPETISTTVPEATAAAFVTRTYETSLPLQLAHHARQICDRCGD